MSCIETILQEISNCDLLPRSGFEQVGWILNWDEASFTYGAYETLITLVETSGVAYEVTSIT